VRHFSWRARARRIIPVLEAALHRPVDEVRAAPDQLRKT
jgi:hypothetical protein